MHLMRLVQLICYNHSALFAIRDLTELAHMCPYALEDNLLVFLILQVNTLRSEPELSVRHLRPIEKLGL